jgi:hypothetical protein
MQESLEQIRQHLEIALAIAQRWQVEVQNTEGDSDLFRKLAFYLTPSLAHWINGAQAGGMKDLEETFARRLAQQETKMLQSNKGKSKRSK